MGVAAKQYSLARQTPRKNLLLLVVSVSSSVPGRPPFWKEVIPELLALGAHLHLKGGGLAVTLFRD